jgi:hypothetical protein
MRPFNFHSCASYFFRNITLKYLFHVFTLHYGQYRVSVKLTGTCLTEAPLHNIFMKMCYIESPLIENDMQDKM